MMTASVRDLRNNFSKLSKRLTRGETIQILSRGKPVARLVPEEHSAPRSFLGATPASRPLPDDIDEPVGVPWDAAK